MKYRICIISLEDQTINALTVFAPILPGTIIEWGTDSEFNTAKHKVLTCTAVPAYF
ncbi:MAG: hypothetical protein IJS45_11530 [Clostridia bacterium]|nr:hypothetical protein [Clostridia bacterium]